MSNMNNWQVAMDLGDEDETVFVIYHYVGGEDPIYTFTEVPSEEEAINIAKSLNEMDINYTFYCFEGECKIVVEGLPSFYPTTEEEFLEAVEYEHFMINFVGPPTEKEWTDYMNYRYAVIDKDLLRNAY